MDTRGSHFYLALYWAQSLAEQTQDKELQTAFAAVAKQLESNEAKIVEELNAAQGRAVNIGGYYHPNEALTAKVMRPSATLNGVLDTVR
jgi:isocitrate dehydrogenase